MTEEDKPAPWERQPGETTRSFEGFRTYRDLGAARSLTKARLMMLDVSQRAPNIVTFKRWSRAHGWVERCAAYDSEMDRLRREKLEHDRRAMVARHAKQANEVAEIAFQRITRSKLEVRCPHCEEDFTVQFPNISPADAVRAYDAAVKIERLARGEPTEISGEVGQRVYTEMEPDRVAQALNRLQEAGLLPVMEGEASGDEAKEPAAVR